MSVEIVAKPHPLRSETYRVAVPAGTVLVDLLLGAPETVYAQVNGEPWERERWSEPLPAGVVNLFASPHGSDALRMVTLVAIAVAAAYTGGAAAGAMGFASGTVGYGIASGVVAAGVTVAGSLAMNYLIPPKLPDTPDSANSTVAKSLTGTQNRMNPYGVIPRVYGNPRWYPPLAARPVTEVSGDDQYLRMLLCLGYGPLRVGTHTVGQGYGKITQASSLPAGTIRIGETALDEFEDVEFEIGTVDQMTLFSQDVQEEAVSVALDFQHKENRGEHRWYDDNVSAVRTTATNTSEISLDLVFPTGLYSINSKGKTDKSPSPLVDFRIEYAPTGTNSWARVPGDSLPRRDPERVWIRPPFPGHWEEGPIVDPAGTYTQVAGPVKQTLRRTYRWQVPVGQYDVRVTRVRTYFDNHEIRQSDAVWTALRSIRDQKPWSKSDTVLMALRIRATDQLNGVVDRLNIRTQSVVRAWVGSSSSLQATSNPAWAYLDAMTGAQVGRKIALNRIDIARLQDWASWCDSQGLRYHWVHDSPETLLDRLRAIAAAGQASFSLQDGLYGVVRDNPQAEVRQVITPRNAAGFESSRQYRNLPHALRVKYIDPDTWLDAERIVCRDGYYDPSSNDPIPPGAQPATVFEDLQTQGVASADEAWHHGQYFMRQAILRPETFQVQMDWENLALTRGDRARLAYDAILVGQAWGRIKEISGNTITLDEQVEMEAGTQYGIRVRLQTGDDPTAPVQTVAGKHHELTLAEPIADMEIGDLVVFGELGKETIDCKVIRIDPGADLTATVTLVDAATDIYDYGTPPAYDPGITPPASLLPPMPLGLVVSSGLDEFSVTPDGSIISRVRVAWQPVMDVWFQRYEVQWRNTDDGAWTQLETVGPWVYITPVNHGDNLQVRVRAVNAYGASAWAAAEHTAIILGELPPDAIPPVPSVRGLELYGQANDTNFTGRDAKFVWREASETEWVALGHEPLDQGRRDQYFRDYEIRVYDVQTGELRRTEHTVDPEYTYTYERNVEDSQRLKLAGPRRQVRFEVYARGRQSQYSERAARLTVQNPAPELPGGWSLTAGYWDAAATFSIPDDTDFRRVNIYLSTQQGFTPSAANLVWQGSDSPANIPGLTQNTAYFYRYEAEDAFGPGAMSGELSFTTKELEADDVSGLGPWAEIQQASREFIEQWLAEDAIDEAKLADKAINLAGNKITGQLQGVNLADAAVDADKLADLSVEAAKLADSAVTEEKIASLAVGTAAIANAAITNAKVGDAAIDTAQIKDAAIESAKIADLAVTDAKIVDLTAAKITSGVLQATTLIESEGLIRTKQGDYEITLGPQERNGALYALNAYDVDTNTLYTGIRGDGRLYARGADIEGKVTITSGSTGYANMDDAPESLDDLDSDAATKLGGIAAGADKTKTVIDGGLVTTGTVQLQDGGNTTKAGITASGTGDSNIRIWAGATFANRASASFRVDQAGRMWATDAEISGEIGAAGLAVAPSGSIRSGKSSYADPSSGWWLGSDSGTPRLNIGNATSYIRWTGSTLQVRGDVEADRLKANAIAIVGTEHLKQGVVTNWDISSSAGVSNFNGVNQWHTVQAVGIVTTGNSVRIDVFASTDLLASGTVASSPTFEWRILRGSTAIYGGPIDVVAGPVIEGVGSWTGVFNLSFAFKDQPPAGPVEYSLQIRINKSTEATAANVRTLYRAVGATELKR